MLETRVFERLAVGEERGEGGGKLLALILTPVSV